LLIEFYRFSVGFQAYGLYIQSKYYIVTSVSFILYIYMEDYRWKLYLK